MLNMKQRYVDWALGFLVALAAFSYLQLVWEYQSSHCKPQHQDATHAPAYEQKIAPAAADPQSHSGDQKIGKHQKAEPSFACGVLGFPAALVAFMDDHEGFFVGAFTAKLAISTTLLWRSTAGLYEAGERQFGLAQKQFTTTNRPRITVRFVQGPFTDAASGRVSAAIIVANTGPTEAIIVAIGCDLAFRREYHWISNVDGTPKPVAPIILQSGQRHIIEVEGREDADDDDTGGFYFNWGFLRAAGESKGRAAESLCVVGEVIYRDGIGTERHTSFLRLYEPERGRWIPDSDPNNEYED